MAGPRLLRAAVIACLAGAGALAQAATVVVTVIDRDGNPVPDAVVQVVPASPGAGPRTPLAAQATIAQTGMRFVPAVTVVPVGARLTFTNNDPWEHHVRGSTGGMAQFTANSPGGFELRLDARAEGQAPRTAEITVARPGAVLLGCHLHASMRGHVFVSDSPWAERTGADGRATFGDLPDGAAQVRVWQADQLVDLPARSVTAGAQPVQVQMQLQVVPRRRRL